MDHPRITPMIQFPANGVPFQSFLPDSDTLSPTIDVDRSLPNMFSRLNLSPAAHYDQPQFPRNNSGCQIGSSVRFNESFVHSLNTSCVMHSDLGVNSFRQHCDSGFDFDFDFDHESHLASKKLFYSTPPFEIAGNKMKFQRLDDYGEQHYCCGSKIIKENQNVHFMSLWSLRDLRGRMYIMAKDQNGCRMLQVMLERSTIEEVEIVVSELVNFVSDLMKDQFGNYLVQKLVSMCNDDQKSWLVRSLTEVPRDIILVCMNPYGTRAVQKLLENLNPNQVKLVIKALCGGAAMLAVDPNGHHVIQYCLINFHNDINKPILTEIANQCYKIATDRSGCCVIQACVEHSQGEVRTHILTEIMVNSVHLAEDPFGNYVLQHILGQDIPELTALLVRQLKGNFAALSCNKYASNVVEKCLIESDEEMSTRIIMELVRSPNSSMLLVDPYANFVIQSALKVSKGLAHDCLCGLISKNTLSMRTNLYGKKIMAKRYLKNSKKRG